MATHSRSSKSFFAGAALAAGITALITSALPALAEHEREARRGRHQDVIAVDRSELLGELGELSAEATALAHFNGARKIARRAERLALRIDDLARDVAEAPLVDDRDGHDRDDHGGGFGNGNGNGNGSGNGYTAMTDADFRVFLGALARVSFSSDQLLLVRDLAPRAWFSAAQVGEIVDALFQACDKLEAAALLYPRIVDGQNGYLVYDHLTFSSDRDELRKRVGH